MESNKLILSSLMQSSDYFTKVIGFLKTDYFESDHEKLVLTTINDLHEKYNIKPDTLSVENSIVESKLPATSIATALEFVKELKTIPPVSSYDYLVDLTEKYLRERAIFNALSLSLEIYDGTCKNLTVNDLPEILSAAISISLKEDESHDYYNDAEKRWDAYMAGDSKIPFDYDILNAITNGGVARKSLNLIAAGVNVGKTLMLIILATMYARMGYNVLYVTNEVNQIDLCKRIDAGNLGVDSDMLLMMSKSKFLQKIMDLQKLHGRMFIHEFATGECTAARVKGLCKKYKTKHGVKIDVIINDYITICAPNSINSLVTANMGIYYKTVAENFRALAHSEDAVVWSAAQFTTEAMESTDPNLQQLGASQGIAATADLVWAVVRTEQLDNSSQLAFKQLKTRYHPIKVVRWTMGISIAKHRLSEVEGNVIEGVTKRWEDMKEHHAQRMAAKCAEPASLEIEEATSSSMQRVVENCTPLPNNEVVKQPTTQTSLSAQQKAQQEKECEDVLKELLGE